MDWSQPLMPFTVDDLLNNPVYGALIRRCRETGQKEVEHALIGGTAADVQLKILAEHEGRIAYAVTIEHLMDPQAYEHSFDLTQRSADRSS